MADQNLVTGMTRKLTVLQSVHLMPFVKKECKREWNPVSDEGCISDEVSRQTYLSIFMEAREMDFYGDSYQ